MSNTNESETGSTPVLSQIIERELRTELSRSYLDYSMSVIVGRAIPDVRDGCKPVQRRILYSMAQNNFYHNRPHFKCARIVGDCMGKYHPHGDQSVYAALVRLAQEFSVRYMLIDKQGNFGSVDGDAAAAMRYTEARLAQISELLLEELDKDTVDFQDNFDGSLKEPVYLPAKLPLLLMNGASGIAVGMSTTIAPHNLNEINDAICAAIDMGVDKFDGNEVEKFIKGPDFPTGGIIMGKQGIKDAIHTGRGSIVLRGKCEIIPNGTGKNRDSIIVTEIPYVVNKSSLIQKIALLVNNKVIPEISDVRDESDRKGMRIVIELKKNSDANACLNRLYHKTQLQNTFNILNLALINNGRQPKVLNYAEIIKEFITHREEVIKRRTIFNLKKAERRMHIIEGLLIAIDNIDAIVQLIKKSADAKDAAQVLMKNYSLTDLQVTEILKMPLSRLTNLQNKKLIDEKSVLVKTIKELKAILADRNKILNIIKTESKENSKRYGDERRTEIQEMEEELKITYKETVPEEQCVIVITQDQKVKRMTLEQYQAQGRGGKGKRGMKMREEDVIVDMFIASSHDTILLFTQQGRVYSVPAFKFPLASRNAQGKALVNYVNLRPGEKIIDIVSIENFSDVKTSLVFVSAKGIAKKTNLNAFSKIRQTGIKCITIREDDQLVRVKLCNPKEEVLIATKNGFAIRFKENELRSSGRTAMGVKGITLRGDDKVVDAVIHDPDTSIITITKKGYGKHTKLKLYRLTHRGGKGVINIKLRSEKDEVIAVKAVPSEKNLLLASEMGLLIRIRTEDIRETGRATMGVIIMRFSADEDEISSVALCNIEEELC
ncbi:DNA gyrase subunit A [Promethearchaeum syntrophicum]|uniref:DNA topoisomerase (ATP-hydrolyzing) n=1 Tax=Promethearchaeum syntrophicum TaxID=2594042 RepID=A0A5B9DCF0_9ARCH|nr:DNA gyrase subunit A [Candidatus Prometheoarchaeum syntrophicum]QEE16376.1 DNA gyrase subunit A [Candidatus Prometheoarchaeum syntrophicum]